MCINMNTAQINNAGTLGAGGAGGISGTNEGTGGASGGPGGGGGYYGGGGNCFLCASLCEIFYFSLFNFFLCTN